MNANLDKGLRFELKILRMIKSRKGKDIVEVFRTAGSHSIFDVVAFTTKGIRLIQAKTDGYLKRDERERIIKFFNSIDKDVVKTMQFEIWYYASKKKKRKLIAKKFGEDFNMDVMIKRLNKLNKKIKVSFISDLYKNDIKTNNFVNVEMVAQLFGG